MLTMRLRQTVRSGGGGPGPGVSLAMQFASADSSYIQGDTTAGAIGSFYTFNVWARLDGPLPAGTKERIIAGTVFNTLFGVRPSDHELRMMASNAVWYDTGYTVPQDGQFHMYTGVCGTTFMRAYVDAVQVANIGIGSVFTGAQLVGGSNTETDRTFNGYIDDFSAYSGNLVQGQIDALYADARAGNAVESPILLWNFEEGTDGQLASGASSVIDTAGGVAYNGTPNGTMYYRFV